MERDISAGRQHGKGQERLVARTFSFLLFYFPFEKCLTDSGGIEIDRAVEHARDYRYLLFQNCHLRAKNFCLCPWLFVDYLYF